MFSQYVHVLNSDVGMSLSDRKLASEEIHSFRTLLSCVDAYMLPIDR